MTKKANFANNTLDIREGQIFFTVNAKRVSGIPLSRDVHIWVTHTNAR